MRIELKHDFGKVTISTSHNDPDRRVYPAVEIQASYAELKPSIDRDLRREVEESHGFYGHLVDLQNTTNLDLSACVRKLPSFELVSIEPKIKPNQLPEGVQT